MSREKCKKSCTVLVLAVLCIAAMLTFSISSAKYAARHEYTLKLTMAEHFTFSAGDRHIFEIPYDGYYAFKLWGGAGGNSKSSWPFGEEIYQLGGDGGKVAAVSHFTKGTLLVIVVGTKGDTADGGFNGGGDGGFYYVPLWGYDYFGGGGGGATDIRLSSDALEYRILVAGGGGGGSGGDPAYASAYGGNGGAQTENYAGASGYGEGYGQGGSLSAGGEGHQHGDFGCGGVGAYSGGGGGGGYYGGGGAHGSGGGGGGGSAYIADNFTLGVPDGMPDKTDYMTDLNDGYAIITFLGSRYMAGKNNEKAEVLHYDVGIPSLKPEEPILDNVTSYPELLPKPESEPEPELESEEWIYQKTLLRSSTL